MMDRIYKVENDVYFVATCMPWFDSLDRNESVPHISRFSHFFSKIF